MRGRLAVACQLVASSSWDEAVCLGCCRCGNDGETLGRAPLLLQQQACLPTNIHVGNIHHIKNNALKHFEPVRSSFLLPLNIARVSDVSAAGA